LIGGLAQAGLTAGVTYYSGKRKAGRDQQANLFGDGGLHVGHRARAPVRLGGRGIARELGGRRVRRGAVQHREHCLPARSGVTFARIASRFWPYAPISLRMRVCSACALASCWRNERSADAVSYLLRLVDEKKPLLAK